MFPNIDPKKMNALMKQMGVAQESIPASRVVIEKEDGKIVISNPSVVKITMHGQESFQVSGDVEENSGEGFSEGDVKTVMEKTGAGEEEARKALKETGDLAEAIMKLS
ncbi:MAG: nascent polypeptide-associated complex protein [Candidatus Pacearchaeota archaeon]|nr:nascent polypeptide-associated complex protein [Candidatus Pacearchaeota archaeon]MDE1848764.1 nascent polypeptide-associated complex protein [Nanoarchaeota archaeon]